MVDNRMEKALQFFMFSCFSKKKKKNEKSASAEAAQLPANHKIQMLGSKGYLKRSSPFRQVRTDNFAQPKQASLTNEGQFQKIDRLLGDELQINFAEKSQHRTHQNQKNNKEKQSKFKDINAYNQSYQIEVTPGLPISRDQFTFFQKKQCLQESEMSQIPDIPHVEWVKTPSIEESDQGEIRNDSKRSENVQKSVESAIIYMQGEEQAIETSITLSNFRQRLSRMPSKQAEEQQDEQTFQQAQNSFYCCECDLNEQFSRAVVAGTIALAQSLFSKMNQQQKNRKDTKGYMPVQVIVRKALAHPAFLDLAKTVLNDQNVSLECRGPSGWTPLQDALLHRSIPLATHLFKQGYLKRQQKFARALQSVETVLLNMPDFQVEIEVKVDSFLPLVGALAPSDLVKVRKVGGRVGVQYSLVGYQFPVCKRRAMGVVVGDGLWAVNRSKGWYCDLLEQLDQEEMILLVQDLLQREIRRGEPIVHDFALKKCKSLFDNDIIQQLCGSEAAKYNIELTYTSTAGKRQSGSQNKQDLAFLSDYGKYRQRKETVEVQQKNRNKKVEIQVWLAEGFGLQLKSFLQVVDLLGVGNTLLGKWSAFIKQHLLPLTTQHQLFPVKIDLPLNYSLYFDIEFKHFKLLDKTNPEPIAIGSELVRVRRKEFQGVVQSRQKRGLILQAFT